MVGGSFGPGSLFKEMLNDSFLPTKIRPSFHLSYSLLGNLAVHRPQKTVVEGKRTAGAVARSGEQKGRGERDGDHGARADRRAALASQKKEIKRAVRVTVSAAMFRLASLGSCCHKAFAESAKEIAERAGENESTNGRGDAGQGGTL